jgi:hypothetical protein
MDLPAWDEARCLDLPAWREAGGVEAEGVEDDDRAQLVAFYGRNNPQKLGQVDQTLQKYRGREDEMWARLHAKYSARDQQPLSTAMPLRRVLRELFHSTGGAFLWTRSEGWGDEASAVGLAAWHGLEVDEDAGTLVGLSLSANGLEGNLPRGLLHSVVLMKLDLSHNKIQGNVPHLPQTLTSLNLRCNQLVGELPATLSSMHQLRELDFSKNRLSGGLGAVAGCRSLTALDLSHNKFCSELPTSFGALSLLHELWLSHNAFYGAIPASFGCLARLRRLALHCNRISAVPAELQCCFNLRELYLHDNELQGPLPLSVLPQQLHGRSALDIVSIGANPVAELADSALYSSRAKYAVLAEEAFRFEEEEGVASDSYSLLRVSAKTVLK